MSRSYVLCIATTNTANTKEISSFYFQKMVVRCVTTLCYFLLKNSIK